MPTPDHNASRATGVSPCVFRAGHCLPNSRHTGLRPRLSTDRLSSKAAFTVLELLTTLASIVVVMGLMVSLARYVRANSADQVTRRVLLELENELDAYHARFAAYPAATAPADETDEAHVVSIVDQQAATIDAALRDEPAAGPTPTPLALRDAWGRPIGYLPHHHPAIGMAPQNRPFFFSAGPDGRYLTRQDNLYSYEQTRPTQLPPPIASAGGVDKANNAAGGD